jgi:hypothetical protein
MFSSSTKCENLWFATYHILFYTRHEISASNENIKLFVSVLSAYVINRIVMYGTHNVASKKSHEDENVTPDMFL